MEGVCVRAEGVGDGSSQRASPDKREHGNDQVRKKDGMRIALSLLDPATVGMWTGSLLSSPTSVFLESEETLIEMAREQKREKMRKEHIKTSSESEER